ncbi:MAG: hypothetical protein EPN79_10475 [Burkholderiaceae bacterium]|nr:MAG: hypothetical protein EPN79_10475 [Burkholderiaceae bacterium]
MFFFNALAGELCIVGQIFLSQTADFPVLRCNNVRCKSKGKRVTVRRRKQFAHGFGLKFRVGSTRVRTRGTQGFSLEKITKVDHGNLQS